MSPERVVAFGHSGPCPSRWQGALYRPQTYDTSIQSQLAGRLYIVGKVVPQDAALVRTGKHIQYLWYCIHDSHCVSYLASSWQTSHKVFLQYQHILAYRVGH